MDFVIIHRSKGEWIASKSGAHTEINIGEHECQGCLQTLVSDATHSKCGQREEEVQGMGLEMWGL